MSEQEPIQVVTATPPASLPDGYTTWNDYWTRAHYEPWRTEAEIDQERQRYLADRLTIRPAIEKGIYPFKEVRLDRADMEWLLATHDNTRGPVDWEDPTQRRRMGLDVRGANLAGAHLRGLPLARLYGGLAFTERLKATPEQREAAAAHFEGADLVYARLEGAWLCGAHLQGASCGDARLEGAVLDDAHLEGANLREVFLDASTTVVNVSLASSEHGEVSFVDVRWGDVNLAVVNWAQLPMLGNERRARAPRNRDGTRKEASARLYDYERAVRANLQLALALRAQGLTQDADRFAYRAQTLQRHVLRRQCAFGAYVFSLLLGVLAGYGYRIGRILLAYALTVAAFAAAFLASTVAVAQAPLTAPLAFDALQLSLNAIHGRVFFAQVGLDTLHTWLATIESVIGVVIEGVFVAMLVQRFFGR